jgi:hypothetical protein
MICYFFQVLLALGGSTLVLLVFLYKTLSSMADSSHSQSLDSSLLNTGNPAWQTPHILRVWTPACSTQVTQHVADSSHSQSLDSSLLNTGNPAWQTPHILRAWTPACSVQVIQHGRFLTFLEPGLHPAQYR